MHHTAQSYSTTQSRQPMIKVKQVDQNATAGYSMRPTNYTAMTELTQENEDDNETSIET